MQYAVYVDAQSGKEVGRTVFKDNEIPPPDVWPPNCTLGFFTEKDKIAYAMFCEDSDLSISSQYQIGTGVYNFVKRTWSFQSAVKIPLIDQVRAMRNSLLEMTDMHARVPDYPSTLQQATLQYRQELRDITKYITKDTKSLNDLPWPTAPDHH